MATKVGVGKSNDPDAFKAGEEAAKAAIEKGGVERPDFVLVYATIGYDYPEMLRGIRSVTKDARLVGVSAAGVITAEGPDQSLKRVALTVIQSDEMTFTPALAKGLRADSEAVGRDLATQLNAVWPEKAKFLLLFSDGLTVNPDALFRGLGSLKEKLPFIGGTAGETTAFKDTYQFFDDQVLEDAAPAVIVSGDFTYDVGVSHGSRPIGVTKKITKAVGTRIYEIDGKPAYQTFRDFMGQEKLELRNAVMGVCLGVPVPEDARSEYEDVILRIPLAHDEKDDSIVMAAEWPEGTEVNICRREPETIIRRSKEISEKIVARNPGKTPAFVLHFDCAGRRAELIGADTAQKEIAADRAPFPADMPWLGWYTYGEIAPVKGINNFHNWTSVVLALYV